jgi:uncharacterized protein YkwD
MINTHAKFMRIVLIAVLGGLLLGLVPAMASAGTNGGRYRDRWLMLKATNNTRNGHELRRVRLNDRMADLARKHSLAMARTKDLFHTANPSRYYLKGQKWAWWGENVGVTAGNVGDLEKAFMNSSPHRANILNHTFRHVAIGAVRRDGLLWVTVFFWG